MVAVLASKIKLVLSTQLLAEKVIGVVFAGFKLKPFVAESVNPPPTIKSVEKVYVPVPAKFKLLTVTLLYDDEVWLISSKSELTVEVEMLYARPVKDILPTTTFEKVVLDGSEKTLS